MLSSTGLCLATRDANADSDADSDADANRVYDISDDDAGAAPYLGVPVCLPGVLEAEAFDVGGLGLGYGETQPE